MRALVWIFSAFVFAVWSGFAWALHLLNDVGSDFVARNADQFSEDAEFVESLSNWMRTISQFGDWAIFAMWAAGAFLIYLIARLITGWLGRNRDVPALPEK